MSTAIAVKRSQMQPMGTAVRAYAIPIDRTSETIVPFDPAAQGQFDLDSPPSPRIDLGWVENFKRNAPTHYEALRTGPRGSVTAQYRSQADALVEFDLTAWGKAQMALAGGGQQMNVLATGPYAPPQPSGGTPIPAAYLQDGSTVMELVLTAADLSNFNAGDIVAVDKDYAGQTGWVGSGIAGAYLAQALDPASHVDFLRRVTFNVSRVTRKTPVSLELTPPLTVRVDGSFGVQKVTAFVDREGGSFFQEWSGLFVVPGDSGGRVCFFYPRLQVAASTGETRQVFEAPLFNHMLHATLRALPSVDPNDGETVLCYRSYFPPEYAAL